MSYELGVVTFGHSGHNTEGNFLALITTKARITTKRS